MKKILLLTGDDKHCKKMLSSIDLSNVEVVIYKTINIKRVFNLVRKNIISIGFILKSIWYEALRKEYKLDTSHFPVVRSNEDVLEILSKRSFDQVVLFKAGLIINEKCLNYGVPILNIHCARLDRYGGLGAIFKAYIDSSYEQEATLHKVTTKIDSGEIVKTEPYVLDKSLSYGLNEDIAYGAGIDLLAKYISNLED